MNNYFMNQGVINSADGNSMIADPPTKLWCDRCEGAGFIYISWPRFRIYLIEEYMAKMDEGEERFHVMWREYRRWHKEGTIRCPECS